MPDPQLVDLGGSALLVEVHHWDPFLRVSPLSQFVPCIECVTEDVISQAPDPAATGHAFPTMLDAGPPGTVS